MQRFNFWCIIICTGGANIEDVLLYETVMLTDHISCVMKTISKYPAFAFMLLLCWVGFSSHTLSACLGDVYSVAFSLTFLYVPIIM
jgi:hypothetical protein